MPLMIFQSVLNIKKGPSRGLMLTLPQLLVKEGHDDIQTPVKAV